MEVILFASLYWAKEILFFYVHFFRRTFYSLGATEVEFPFFHMKKASGGENSEVYADALRGHSAPLGSDPTLSWLHPPHRHF